MCGNFYDLSTDQNNPFLKSDFLKVLSSTVNSLMFAGINVCVFETKPFLRGLILRLIAPVNYRYMNYVCGYSFCDLKMVANFVK